MSDILINNGILPQVSSVTGPRKRTWRTKQIPSMLYAHYQRQSAATMTSLPSGHERYCDVPAEFVELMPLDQNILDEDLGRTVERNVNPSGSHGYPSIAYKVISTVDGFPYAIRRVENVKSSQSITDKVITDWARVSHPSIVRLRRIMSMQGNVRFFLHDYYPGARTLYELYLEGDNEEVALTEQQLWSFACQIATGLHAAHSNGVSFRGFSARHVLLTGHNRVRLSRSGIADVLESESESRDHSQVHSREDLRSFGELLVQLATRNKDAFANFPECLRDCDSRYSNALLGFLVKINNAPGITIGDVLSWLAPKIIEEYNNQMDTSDALDSYLSREMENSRLLRLLIKLGFVTSYAKNADHPSFIETGDKYQLSLFQNFLFQQTTADGRPILDVGHVITALNELDVGSKQRIILASPESSSLYVSTYSALNSALKESYADIKKWSEGDALKAKDSSATLSNYLIPSRASDVVSSSSTVDLSPIVPTVIQERIREGHQHPGIPRPHPTVEPDTFLLAPDSASARRSRLGDDAAPYKDARGGAPVHMQPHFHDKGISPRPGFGRSEEHPVFGAGDRISDTSSGGPSRQMVRPNMTAFTPEVRKPLSTAAAWKFGTPGVTQSDPKSLNPSSGNPPQQFKPTPLPPFRPDYKPTN